MRDPFRGEGGGRQSEARIHISSEGGDGNGRLQVAINMEASGPLTADGGGAGGQAESGPVRQNNI